MAYDHNRVLVAIYERLGRAPGLRVEGVARELGVSPRTVHRILADAGLGFVQVKAMAAAEAVERIRDEKPGVKRAEIAARLGYASPRALTAFLARNVQALRPAGEAGVPVGRAGQAPRGC